MFLLMVLLPAVLPSDTGQLLILGMLYPISLMIIIQGVIATTNGLELHEMTFVLSRPVSRRVYIFAKICSSLVTCSLTLFVGIFCTLINISIFLLRDHVNVIAKQNVS
jgi:ABC-type transport system involved in multi-copper enzyme maturation permease subunit